MKISKTAVLALIFILAVSPFSLNAACLEGRSAGDGDVSIAITNLKITIPEYPQAFQDNVFESEDAAREKAKKYTYKRYKDFKGTYALTASVGIEAHLGADISPAILSLEPMVWKSSNSEVAQVSEEGVLTTVAPGIAVITLTDEEERRSCELIVTVMNGDKTDLETFDYIPDFALAREGLAANLSIFATRMDLAKALWHIKNSPSYLPTYSDEQNAQYMVADKELFPDARGLNIYLSREDLAYALWRYSGCPKARSNEIFANMKNVPEEFSDVDPESNCYDAIKWIVNERLMNPFEEDLFNPNATVSKEFFTQTLYKYCVRYSHISNVNSRSIFDKKRKKDEKDVDNGTWKKITGAEIKDTDIYDMAMEYVELNQTEHKYKYQYGGNNITTGEVDCSAFVTHIYKTLLGTVEYKETKSQGSYKESPDKTKTPYTSYSGYKGWNKQRGIFEYYRTNTKPLKSGVYELISKSDYQYVFVDKYGLADIEHMTVARWGAYLSSLGVKSSGIHKVKTNEKLTGNSWKWFGEEGYNVGDIIIFGDSVKTTKNGNSYLYSDGDYKHMAIFAGYLDITGDGIEEALIFHCSSKLPASYEGFDTNYTGIMLSDITAYTRLYNQKECNVQVYRMFEDKGEPAMLVTPTPTPSPSPTPAAEEDS